MTVHANCELYRYIYFPERYTYSSLQLFYENYDWKKNNNCSKVIYYAKAICLVVLVADSQVVDAIVDEAVGSVPEDEQLNDSFSTLLLTKVPIVVEMASS